jgi:UPF0042 nucleotide-binding protein
VLVTGLSGSGKTTAMHALEDTGFYCVDNLPVELLGDFIALAAREGLTRVALVVDAREGGFLAGAEAEIEKLRAKGRAIEILFLDARPEALLRRFSETRRRHPMAGEVRGGGTEDALAAERTRMESLRVLADAVVDTTELTPHRLRLAIMRRYGGPEGHPHAPPRMVITVVSFGYRHGLPQGADVVMDVRFLPNPHFVPGLRDQDGLDPEVARWVVEGPGEGRAFLDRFGALLDDIVPRYAEEGKAFLTLAIGCTGGRHRSVALAEALGERLRAQGWDPMIVHRDRER